MNLTDSPINPGRLRLAGCLAMLNALLTIPWFIMTFVIAGKEGLLPKLADAVMQVSSTFIFVYTTVMLRTLLNRRYAFHLTDRFIDWLVKANIVLTAVSLIGIISPDVASSAGTFALILIVPLGVIQILFGLKLQQLPSDLEGLLRPYCYLTMATGLCLASIVMLPVGIITGAISDIMLGTIFFQTITMGRTIDTQA
jgi:hypothetical protein